MFLAQTPFLSTKLPPVRLEFRPDGSVLMVANEGGLSPRCYMKAQHVSDFELNMSYVDARPGDCLIMSKRTLHMSDPRPHLADRTVNRLAINMRVVLRPPSSSTVPLDTSYGRNRMRKAYLPLAPCPDSIEESASQRVARDAFGLHRCSHDHCQHVEVGRHDLVMSEN
mmetsp:Transcript_72348/g.143635  ORF Transcript_72348/g.143635 Transcript_72348/m.143635 type:complete len:168 (-) Transcript_72348:154-657(-)